MKLEGLYQDMKDALGFLGLRFHDKELVDVTLDGGDLVFSYGGRSARVEIPRKEASDAPRS